MFRDERIASYLAGDLTDDQRAAFEREIVNDPEGLAELVGQQCVDAGLQTLLNPQTEQVESAIMATVRSVSGESAVDRVLADTVRAEPASRFNIRGVLGWFNPLRWQPRFTKFAAACLLLSAVLIAGMVIYEKTRSGGPTGGDPASAANFARLTHGAAVVWENRALEIGASIPGGTWHLRSGVIELEFTNGVRVILEGPAQFSLISPMETALNFGQLSAEIPPRAKGFSVEAGGARITDLGTAFGINRPGAGPVEVHVFSGEVEVARRNSRTPRRLTEGNALRLGSDTEVALRANRVSFVTEAELLRREATELRARYEAWRGASRILNRDPATLVHFNFEEQNNSDRLLTNRAASAQSSTHGTVSGSDWTEGRWPGKGALEFQRADGRVRLTVPGSYRSLTYLAWVRVEALPNARNALALADTFRRGEVHWQINQAGQLELSVRTADGGGHRDALRSPPVITPDRFGQWIHLAAVYDGGSGMMLLYANGERVATKAVENRRPIPLAPGPLELGNWTPIADPESTIEQRRKRDPAYFAREFHGRMDEFVLLSRVLSADEIRRQYEAGRPRIVLVQR